MSKVNISDLARQLADKKVLDQTEAELFIRKMFDVANEGLERDKLVKVKWLGTFKVQAVKDRESVDVNTGDRIVIEGRDKISFTPDTVLKEIVNKPFAQFETVVVNDGVDFEAIDLKFDHIDEEGISDHQEKDSLNADSELEETSSSEITPADTSSSEIAQSENSSSQTVSMEQTSSRISSVLAEASSTLAASTESSEPEESVEIVASAMTEPAETEQNAQEKIAQTQIAQDQAEQEQTAQKQAEQEQAVQAPIVPVPSEPSNVDNHHLMIPRYVVVVAILVVVLLIGGMGYFAFNFGKMQAQRDELALQLKLHQQSKVLATKPVASKPAPSQEELLRKKAMEDSIRLAKEAEAVKAAESAKESENLTDKSTKEMAVNQKAVATANKKSDATSQKSTDAVELSSGKYDKDPRIRTGAYRIVGVQQVVTAKAGQSLQSISSRYLGPGMECYLEALNGSGPLKDGQKVKIPKLELKKK